MLVVPHCRIERRTKSNQRSVKFNRNDTLSTDDKKERVSNYYEMLNTTTATSVLF